MDAIVQTHALRKDYGDLAAVDNISLTIQPGTITGLIGPNGAGKTTLLRSLLGLNTSEGGLDVLGMDPRRDRTVLQQEVCFIADTAVLPGWMRVDQVLDYVAGVHPRFNRDMAEAQLSMTEVKLNRRVKQLSKGMNVQLHLALVMAIDARLLILDEPHTWPRHIVPQALLRAVAERLLRRREDHPSSLLTRSRKWRPFLPTPSLCGQGRWCCTNPWMRWRSVIVRCTW